MINAHKFTGDICAKASKLGFKLAFNQHEHGHEWAWSRNGFIACVGWADPADKVCALALACEDLAKAMRWGYVSA